MSKSITLSPKHGVNPSIVICPICKKETSIALFGRLKGDVEAPKQVEGDLCDECKKKYVTIIEVESEATKKATGRYVYVPKENLKVDCKNNIALMTAKEFTELFINNYESDNS